MHKLANQVAIVTGGACGIGRGIALELANAGAHIAIVDIDPDRAQLAAEEVHKIGRRSIAIQADVSTREGVARMLRTTVAEFDGLNILINNAGISRSGPFLDISDESWDLVLNTNLKSVFMGTQEAARHWVKMGQPGSVINISSVDDAMPYPNNPHYNASKAGVKILTQSNALALAEHHIRVNCIGPGICDSELIRPSMADPKWQQGLSIKIPWGRIGQPADIGKAAVFLASDDAEFITGITLYVDGGHMISAHEQIMKQFRPG